MHIFWEVNVMFTRKIAADVSKGISASIFSNKVRQLKIHPFHCESPKFRKVQIERKYENAKFEILTTILLRTEVLWMRRCVTGWMISEPLERM